MKKEKKTRMTFREVWRLHQQKYILMLPFIILFIVFTLVPVLVSIGLSFTSFNLFETPQFVGFRNYINLIAFDPVFLTAIKNTMLFAIVTGPASYLLCFVLAWLINELPPKVRAVMTLVFYAPSISGGAYMIWKLIFV